MPDPDAPSAVLTRLVDTLDAQQWDDVPGLLGSDFAGHYVHTGERFDAAGYLAVNRDYPGRWRLSCEDLLEAGGRAVARVRVTDGDQSFYVACFADVYAGRIVRLVEVWTEAVAPAPERNQE